MTTLQRTRALTTPSLYILVFMISVGPFGDTIYAPSLPSISEAFLTPYHTVQLTITFYLVGYSISQILYGPFSDRLGRKPIMITGAVIFLFSSILCLLAPNITLLIFARFLQGFGACAGAVISSAAVRDAFSAEEQGKVFAKMNIAFAMAPGAGAMVGTFVPWQSNFIILLVLAIILLIAVLMGFPETLKQKNKEAIQPRTVLLNYVKLYQAKGYFVYLCVLGLNIGMVYSCLVEAPTIVIDILQLSKPWFIVIALGVVLAFMMGSFICTRLCQSMNPHTILLLGMLSSLSGALLLLVLMLLKIIHLYSLLFPVIIIFTGIALVLPVATAQALSPFTSTAGSAAAMMGFFQMGVASFVTAGVTFLPLNALLAMPLSFTVLALTGIIILRIYRYQCRQMEQSI